MTELRERERQTRIWKPEPARRGGKPGSSNFKKAISRFCWVNDCLLCAGSRLSEADSRLPGENRRQSGRKSRLPITGKPLTATEEPLTATGKPLTAAGSLLTDGNRWLSGEKSHLPEKRSRQFSAESRLSILGKGLFSKNR